MRKHKELIFIHLNDGSSSVDLQAIAPANILQKYACDTHGHIHMYTCTYVYTYVHICMNIHMYIYTYIHMCTYVNVHTYVHIHVICTYTYVHLQVE